MVVVAGVEIAAAMTYLADSRKADNPEPAAIDVALPVARAAVHSGERELGYWPQYASLTPEQRRIYLQWLAGGRRKPPSELGYTFLFMYGLERRALVESCDQAAVFDEVVRLRAMYEASGLQASRSFDSSTSCFVWFLATAYANVLGVGRIERLARQTTCWTEEVLAALLAWFAESGTPMPAWVAILNSSSGYRKWLTPRPSGGRTSPLRS